MPDRSMGPEGEVISGKKVRLTDISSRAFEHPADRAALTALRKVPGFDLVLRKLIGLIGERSLRYLYLGGAVRVGPRQFPLIHRVYEEALDTLDVREKPELFVSQTPFVNAGAVGVDRPFIVLNSAALQLMNEEELRFILGHELGHIMSDHVLYKTMLALLLRVGVSNFGIPLGGLAFYALLAALSEWHRKSEISCDRAGMLAVQDKELALRTLMKMASGANASQTNLDDFLAQAKEYESGGGVLDSVVKLLNLFGMSHPLNVVRVTELKTWAESEEYAKIVRGEYPKRSEDPKTKLYDEFKEGARSYSETVSKSTDPLITWLRDIGADLKKTFGID